MASNTAFETRLEERLRRAELITDMQLETVKQLRSSSPLSLAEALVELDILAESEIDRIVQSVHETRSVKLEDVQIEQEAVRHIPRYVALANRCIPIRRSGNTLVVAVCDPNIESLRESLRKVTDFEIATLLAEQDAMEHALYIHYGDASNQAPVSSPVATRAARHSSPWSLPEAWDFTFESFLDHDGGLRAEEVAKAVAYGSGEQFNSPILFVGPDCCGKSHLLKAVRNYCAGKEPLRRVIYCTGKELKSAWARYRLAGIEEALRFELKEADILLIDDIELAWGNEYVESELGNVISWLRGNGASVVASISDSEFLAGPLTPQLRACLAQGTEVVLSAPDRATLLKVLKMRQGAGRRLPADDCETEEDVSCWCDLERLAVCEAIGRKRQE